MKRYVLDSNALLTYIQNRPGAPIVEKILVERSRFSAELLMSTVNWGETFYTLRRHGDVEQAHRSLAPFRIAVRLMPATVEAAENAGEIKTIFHLGYADAFAAELAITQNATLVTADPAFKKLGKNLVLRMLPSARRSN